MHIIARISPGFNQQKVQNLTPEKCHICRSRSYGKRKKSGILIVLRGGIWYSNKYDEGGDMP